MASTTYQPLGTAPDAAEDGSANGGDPLDPEAGVMMNSPPRKAASELNLPDDAEQIDLDEDVYGAVIFSLVYDSYELLTGVDYDGLDWRVNAYRIFFCLLLLCCNYLLQIGLLVIIYTYVALPSMSNAQRVYQSYHAEVFVSGDFQQDLWDKWDGADDLCNIAFGNYWFMFMILTLWWINMVIEVRKTVELYNSFAGLGNTTNPHTIISRVKDPEKLNLILNLTVWIRAVLYTLLILPKFIIAAFLLVVGTIWLASTDSFENLVLNSVALGFLINIDETIFAGLVPKTMKKNIAITKIVNLSVSAEAGYLLEVMRRYRDSTLCFIAVVGGVGFYMSSWGQMIPGIGIFPGYLKDTSPCSSWWGKKALEVCAYGTECFKLG